MSTLVPTQRQPAKAVVTADGATVAVLHLAGCSRPVLLFLGGTGFPAQCYVVMVRGRGNIMPVRPKRMPAMSRDRDVLLDRRSKRPVSITAWA